MLFVFVFTIMMLKVLKASMASIQEPAPPAAIDTGTVSRTDFEALRDMFVVQSQKIDQLTDLLSRRTS